MVTGNFGVQMVMLKGEIEEQGIYNTLKKVRKLGYKFIEVANFPNIDNLMELRRVCVYLGIEVASLGTVVEPLILNESRTLLINIEKIVVDCQKLNCNLLQIPILSPHAFIDDEAVQNFFYHVDDLAQKLLPMGITLYAQHVHRQSSMLEELSWLNRIYNNTKYLHFGLDIPGYRQGCENLTTYSKAYEGRVAVTRIKGLDYDYSKGIDVGATNENYHLNSILDACTASGPKFFFIGQEEPYRNDAFTCLALTAAKLKQLGFLNWFN
ncbi:hypothetical protein [Paenibacillus sp. P36]|uniref:hypothetical protein n=1 Tax=Paenibacillus sp. P36 TaxID=3342538 RepID=UPI0038B29894